MKYLLISALFSLPVLSQGIEDTEAMLAGHLKKMLYYKYDKPDGDSVMIQNAQFKKLFIEYIRDNPSTINSSFDSLVKYGLMTTSSSDGSLRIYSWDTQTGGTMRFYDNLYQYRSMGKVYYSTAEDTAGLGDPRSWYSEIYTMDDGTRKYYLGVYNADYSNRDKAQGIRFFAIENGSLNTGVKLVKTVNGHESDIGIGYDFFSVPDNSERPFRLVVYNEKDKTITLPIVGENGNVTNKLAAYRFINGYFEETK